MDFKKPLILGVFFAWTILPLCAQQIIKVPQADGPDLKITESIVPDHVQIREKFFITLVVENGKSQTLTELPHIDHLRIIGVQHDWSFIPGTKGLTWNQTVYTVMPLQGGEMVVPAFSVAETNLSPYSIRVNGDGLIDEEQGLKRIALASLSSKTAKISGLTFAPDHPIDTNTMSETERYKATVIRKVAQLWYKTAGSQLDQLAPGKISIPLIVHADGSAEIGTNSADNKTAQIGRRCLLESIPFAPFSPELKAEMGDHYSEMLTYTIEEESARIEHEAEPTPTTPHEVISKKLAQTEAKPESNPSTKPTEVAEVDAPLPQEDTIETPPSTNTTSDADTLLVTPGASAQQLARSTNSATPSVASSTSTSDVVEKKAESQSVAAATLPPVPPTQMAQNPRVRAIGTSAQVEAAPNPKKTVVAASSEKGNQPFSELIHFSHFEIVPENTPAPSDVPVTPVRRVGVADNSGID